MLSISLKDYAPLAEKFHEGARASHSGWHMHVWGLVPPITHDALESVQTQFFLASLKIAAAGISDLGGADWTLGFRRGHITLVVVSATDDQVEWIRENGGIYEA